MGMAAFFGKAAACWLCCWMMVEAAVCLQLLGAIAFVYAESGVWFVGALARGLFLCACTRLLMLL